MNILKLCTALVAFVIVFSGCAKAAPNAETFRAATPTIPEAAPTPTALPANPTVSASPAPTSPSGAIRATATAAPAANATATAGLVSEPKSSRLVLGYYVPYDVTSWRTLQAQAGRLDYVSAQWATIDACGSIGSRDDRTLIAYARSHGIKLLPSLLTLDSTLNHRLLTDEQVSARAIEQIVSYVVSVGYDGFDLDLEDVAPADRQNYSAFVARLSKALHQQGKILMAALPAKSTDAKTGWSGAFEYAAIGPSLDFAMLMTYDYSWSSGPAGSIAPVYWVDQVMRYASSQMPKEKVLLGVAFYGYDWNTTTGGRARALRYADGLALAKKYDKVITQDKASASATFNYQAKADDKFPQQDPLPALNHEISTRTPPACNKPLPIQTPAPKPTAMPTPGTQPQQHQVWLEDARSLAARLELADRNQVAGIGAWRLGQEDPDVWQKIDAWRGR